MTKLEFIQADDGWYECEVVAAQSSYTIQLSREKTDAKNHLMVYAKMDDAVGYAVIKRLDGLTDSNVILKLENIVPNMSLLIRSRSEVKYARIDGNIKGDSSVEFIPEDVSQAMFRIPNNPYFHVDGANNIEAFATFLSENDIESLRVDVDDSTVETPSDNIEGEAVLLTEEMIAEVAQTFPYFADKAGKYFCQYGAYFDLPVPAVYGEHTCAIYVNGDKVYEGTFTIEQQNDEGDDSIQS